MTKEDKQIIDRAVKEEWRIGDRTRLKRLLEKNLKLYRENVELEKVCQDLSDKFDYQVKQVMELEQENAELKAEIENDRDLPTVAYMQGAENQKKKDEKQLTKARELIEKLISLNRKEWVYSDVREEAEQFLQEVEK